LVDPAPSKPDARVQHLIKIVTWRVTGAYRRRRRAIWKPKTNSKAAQLRPNAVSNLTASAIDGNALGLGQFWGSGVE